MLSLFEFFPRSKNLRAAVENDPDGREGMALAQYVTAMAYSNVGLGIAHSMAHTLGAVYDTPHGVACAMMLPIVMEFNQDYTGDVFVSVNGENYWIRRGVTVDVPDYIAEVLESSQREDENAVMRMEMAERSYLEKSKAM